MCKINGNEPAIPCEVTHFNGQLIGTQVSETSGICIGLTIRQQFAAMAMQGILSDQTYMQPNQSRDIAIHAVEIADALINELNKEVSND